MSILRASHALRSVASTIPRRHLAIMPTVKTATDTSSVDFPAPSHVGLSSTAADLARQISAFYSNPDSVIKLDEETRKSVEVEIMKKVQSIPDNALSEAWTAAHVSVPSEIRIGDNPYFGVYEKLRQEGKLA